MGPCMALCLGLMRRSCRDSASWGDADATPLSPCAPLTSCPPQLLGQQGRTKDAIQALAGLAQLGVQPDALAATTLVRACAKDMTLAQVRGNSLKDASLSFTLHHH